MEMTYSISDRLLTIYDSYKIRSVGEMMKVLERVRRENAGKEYAILRRTDSGIIDELKAHNLFYDMHVLRAHTGTVDLEYPQRWWFRVVYRMMSLMA